MTARAIPTRRPGKGDLVVGHRVFAFLPRNLPAVPGVIVEASAATVTLEVPTILALIGLPRRTRWSWRRSVGAFQQAGVRTSPGWGLVIDARPK